MEEKKRSQHIFGRGSQVDSADFYKAATLTLGQLNIALFKLEKKNNNNEIVFARRLLVQISNAIPLLLLERYMGEKEARGSSVLPASGCMALLSLPGSERWEADGAAHSSLTHCKEGRTEQAQSDITMQARWVASHDLAANYHWHLKGSESVISMLEQIDSHTKLTKASEEAEQR